MGIKKKSGPRKPRLGRPPLPKGAAKAAMVSIRGTPAEVDAWTKAAGEQPLAAWGRDAMNEKARRSK